MATVKAFRAVRPTPEKAARVAALPYDVYSRAEAKREIQDKPLSFLRVDRAETTMDDSVDTYDPKVYEQARHNLHALIENGVFEKEAAPALYVYELTLDGRSQTGIVGCTSVDEYENGTIKRHELTRADKEADRIHHVDVCDANTGPIFLTYRHQKPIDAFVARIKQSEPLYDFEADDGVRHRVWLISERGDITELEAAFADVPALYIADGHHRCASAAKVAQMRRARGYSGREPFNYFLSVIFPDKDLKILDYNRVVKDLNGLSAEAFLEQVAHRFEISPSAEPVAPEEKGTFGMYLDGQWYTLRVREAAPEDPVAALDVSVLYDNLLAPVLGIGDPRTDARIDFVGGIRGLGELERRAQDDMRVAFSMYPTGIDELMAIADQGLLMPPKSTWFEPKLRSGLFIHELS